MTNTSISGLERREVHAMAGKFGALTLALLIAGCGTPVDRGLDTEGLTKPRHPAKPEPECQGPAASVVTIQFEGGCPSSVSVALDPSNGGICPGRPPSHAACVKLGANDKFIRWETGVSAITDYGIVFDPFVGPLKPPNPNGCLKMKLDPSTPSDPAGLVYKYSIIRTNANTGQDCVLDPQIIVQP